MIVNYCDHYVYPLARPVLGGVSNIYFAGPSRTICQWSLAPSETLLQLQTTTLSQATVIIVDACSFERYDSCLKLACAVEPRQETCEARDVTGRIRRAEEREKRDILCNFSSQTPKQQNLQSYRSCVCDTETPYCFPLTSPTSLPPTPHHGQGNSLLRCPRHSHHGDGPRHQEGVSETGC